MHIANDCKHTEHRYFVNTIWENILEEEMSVRYKGKNKYRKMFWGSPERFNVQLIWMIQSTFLILKSVCAEPMSTKLEEKEGEMWLMFLSISLRILTATLLEDKTAMWPICCLASRLVACWRCIVISKCVYPRT